MIKLLKESPEIEEFNLEDGGRKRIKYIIPTPIGDFCRSSKYFALFYEESIYDNKGILISKKIKKNPHYISSKKTFNRDEI